MAPYLVAFATGTYHFAVMALVLPLAGHGLVSFRRNPRTVLRGNRGRVFLAVIVVFVVIQLEYGYHAVVNLPS
jgi:hypothetical protein